jgi:hypothetical protein
MNVSVDWKTILGESLGVSMFIIAIGILWGKDVAVAAAFIYIGFLILANVVMNL